MEKKGTPLPTIKMTSNSENNLIADESVRSCARESGISVISSDDFKIYEQTEIQLSNTLDQIAGPAEPDQEKEMPNDVKDMQLVANDAKLIEINGELIKKTHQLYDELIEANKKVADEKQLVVEEKTKVINEKQRTILELRRQSRLADRVQKLEDFNKIRLESQQDGSVNPVGVETAGACSRVCNNRN